MEQKTGNAFMDELLKRKEKEKSKKKEELKELFLEALEDDNFRKALQSHIQSH